MEEVVSKTAMKRVIIYIVATVFLVAMFPLVYNSNWHGTFELHTIAETASAIIAGFVGLMAIIRFLAKRDDKFLLIGVAFIGSGLLDAFHAVVTSNYFISGSSLVGEGLKSWAWSSSSIFLAIMMVVILYIVKDTKKRDLKTSSISIGSVVVITGFTILLIFLFNILSSFEFITNSIGGFVTSIIFFIALIGFLKKKEWWADGFEFWIVMFLIVGFIYQLLYVPFSIDLFDIRFGLAHLLKILSYIFILFGVIDSMHGSFISVNTRSKRMNKRNKFLADSNVELERERIIAENRLRKIEDTVVRMEENRSALNRMNDVMISRENKMVELKNENAKLKANLQELKRSSIIFEYEKNK